MESLTSYFSGGLSVVLVSFRWKLTVMPSHSVVNSKGRWPTKTNINCSPVNRNKAQFVQLYERPVHQTSLICIPEFLLQVQKYVIPSLESTHTSIESQESHGHADSLVSQHLGQDGAWHVASSTCSSSWNWCGRPQPCWPWARYAASWPGEHAATAAVCNQPRRSQHRAAHLRAMDSVRPRAALPANSLPCSNMGDHPQLPGPRPTGICFLRISLESIWMSSCT